MTPFRAAIMGNSGSGKSTLARALSDGGRIPILDLDTIAWLPQSPPMRRPLPEVQSDLDRFCDATRDWIVEGCYGDIIELVCRRGCELIFLNPGIEQCIRYCLARPWEPHKYTTKEEQDKNLEFLLNWVREYEVRSDDCSLQAHHRIFDAYNGPKREVTQLAGNR